MIYFNLDVETIKENCKFQSYYNKTDITFTVLDGGNEIVLANWPNDKHVIYNIINDISIKLASHPYGLVNRSVLCEYGMEIENHFLLKSLAACHNTNTAFINYCYIWQC